MLAHGLQHVEACVFLDDFDRKMVCKRRTNEYIVIPLGADRDCAATIIVVWQVVDRSPGSAAVPLDRCGLAVEARFSFFGGCSACVQLELNALVSQIKCTPLALTFRSHSMPVLW